MTKIDSSVKFLLINHFSWLLCQIINTIIVLGTDAKSKTYSSGRQ
jgi:hypothetical protein